jgi:hypothetical protein
MPRIDQPRFAVAALGGALAFIAIVQLGWSVAAILSPEELNYGEAIVYSLATRVVHGEPLYQPLDRPPYTVAAYTPLYYWAAAGLQALFGPGFWPGRCVSFIAGLLTASLVARLAAGQAGDRRAGAFAALLFLALGLPWMYLWSALYRVDLLGVALSLGAIATLVGGTGPRRLILGGALAGLAVLTKQTLIAAELAGAVWLWRRDRAGAALFAGTGLGIALGTCLVLELTTGAFLTNSVVANMNPFSRDTLAGNLTTLVHFQAGPLAAAILYLSGRKGVGPKAGAELLACYWLASLVPLVGLGKVGSSQNYWIELAAVTAVLATLGTWSRLRESAGPIYRGARPPVVPILLLGVTLAAVMPGLTTAALSGVSEPRPSPGPAGAFDELVARVRSEPREVLAEPLDVVVLADRPILLEPTIFGILQRAGSWDAGPLVRRVCGGEVGLLILGEPLDRGGPGRYRYGHWPEPVFTALRETMVLQSQPAGRFLYVPREGLAGTGCSAAAS